METEAERLAREAHEAVDRACICYKDFDEVYFGLESAHAAIDRALEARDKLTAAERYRDPRCATVAMPSEEDLVRLLATTYERRECKHPDSGELDCVKARWLDVARYVLASFGGRGGNG